MNSPATLRIKHAENTPGGHIVPSGVEDFKRCIAGPEASAAFYKWRSDYFAKKMYLALQDLIVHQPRDISSDNLLVQYGVTQGLTIAAQMLADPSVLWPGVFGEGTLNWQSPEPDEPQMDFSTPSDVLMGD